MGLGERIPYTYTTARSFRSKIPRIGNELGLGWYDYGARMLNPTIGRWNGVDALAEDYLAWSPFNYTLGNPIRLIDSDGRSVSLATMIQNAWDATPEDGAVKFTVNSSASDSDDDQGLPQGLTTHRLREIAGSTSWGSGTSGITFNRRAGRAFQNTALSALHLTPENGKRVLSKERKAFGHRSGLVQPDYIGPVVDTDTRGRVRKTYANSTFVEVKAVDGTLTLSSSRQQIRGLIDIAANSPAGKSGVFVLLYFL